MAIRTRYLSLDFFPVVNAPTATTTPSPPPLWGPHSVCSGEGRPSESEGEGRKKKKRRQRRHNAVFITCTRLSITAGSEIPSLRSALAPDTNAESDSSFTVNKAGSERAPVGAPRAEANLSLHQQTRLTMDAVVLQ